ncbi:unnamed protein product [Absidia cylindrospora]
MRLNDLSLGYVLIFLFFDTVHAIPKFHTVNGQFHNGTTCPAQTKRNVQCPTICVASLDQCPTLPSCPPTETLCGDGSCHNDCKQISPAESCGCPSNPSARLLKCPVAASIDIPEWDPSKNDIQTYSICSAHYNYSSTLPTWANMQLNTSILWNVCDTPAGITFPIQAPFVISYLVIFLGFFAFLGIWLLYKTLREMSTNYDPPKITSASKTN